MTETMSTRTIVLASGSAGKLAELAPLFAAQGMTLVTQAELGVGPGPEEAPTFIENALSKARHVSAATGRPAIADDSGIIVPALGGDPGVHSARYAGVDHVDDDARDIANNRLLLERMQGIEDRRAVFCCVLVVLRHADDPLPLIAQGHWHGELLSAPRGEGGFGYDPLFLDPDTSRSAAELNREEKSSRSHRGRAVRALIPMLAAMAEPTSEPAGTQG